MSNSSIATLRDIFMSRLHTLSLLIDRAEAHFGTADFLGRRLYPDMLPFGAQVAIACSQARNFAHFCQGKPANNFDETIASIGQARAYLADALSTLQVGGGEDAQLNEQTSAKLGPQLRCDLSGSGYVHDLLLPNFYFHLVTAYAILRAAGVDIGKKDFLRHLGPFIRPA